MTSRHVGPLSAKLLWVCSLPSIYGVQTRLPRFPTFFLTTPNAQSTICSRFAQCGPSLSTAIYSLDPLLEMQPIANSHLEIYNQAQQFGRRCPQVKHQSFASCTSPPPQFSDASFPKGMSLDCSLGLEHHNTSQLRTRTGNHSSSPRVDYCVEHCPSWQPSPVE